MGWQEMLHTSLYLCEFHNASHVEFEYEVPAPSTDWSHIVTTSGLSLPICHRDATHGTARMRIAPTKAVRPPTVTTLVMAVDGGKADQVATLLSRGVNPDWYNNGQSQALAVAASYIRTGDSAIVDLLLGRFSSADRYGILTFIARKGGQAHMMHLLESEPILKLLYPATLDGNSRALQDILCQLHVPMDMFTIILERHPMITLVRNGNDQIATATQFHELYDAGINNLLAATRVRVTSALVEMLLPHIARVLADLAISYL
jgi:hypothetical protein